MNNNIKLDKKDILRLSITTDEGIDTGEFLEFDLFDVSWHLKIQELTDKDKENKLWLRKEFIIIDKKEDVKDKGSLFSRNELAKYKITEEFIKKEEEAYNLFLGENGVRKLLNGNKPNINSFKKIDKYIEEQILPYINQKAISLEEIIEKKYGDETEEELL